MNWKEGFTREILRLRTEMIEPGVHPLRKQLLARQAMVLEGIRDSVAEFRLDRAKDGGKVVLFRSRTQ